MPGLVLHFIDICYFLC